MNKIIKRVIAVTAATVLIAAAVSFTGCSRKGTDYYVSSSSGDDAADGLSPEKAWKSFANIKGMRLTEGDRVLLRCGDEWNETLYIHANGTEKNWVTVTSYGDFSLGKPVIRLNNGRDDICLVAEDCATKSPYINYLNYIAVEGLEFRNARMGIYFRYFFSSDNRGVRVRDCDFYSMDVPELVSQLAVLETDEHILAEDMVRPKESLSSYTNGIYRSAGGGISEISWPAAIMVGGVTIDGDSNHTNATKVSDIDISGCFFQDCVAGISSWFYYAHEITGAAELRVTKNWRITDCLFDGTLAGCVTIENGDGGYTGDVNGWGVLKNVRLIGGMDYKCMYGSTGGCFQTCKNFLITGCEFSHVNNNGSNDGCGWDFEGSDYNVTMTDTVFHNNEAHAILMMQALGPCKDCTLTNLLFYNNILNPANSQYSADFTIFNPPGIFHSNILFENTLHYLINKHKVTGKRPDAVNTSFDGLTTVNNSEQSVDAFSTRFAFNKDGDTEGFTADGVTGLSVSDGALRFTTAGGNSAVFKTGLGINQLLFTKFALYLNSDKAGEATLYFTTLADANWQKAGSFRYSAGSDSYTVPLEASSPITGWYIRFGSDGASVAIDWIDSVADVSASAMLFDGNRLRYTVSGKAAPVFSSDVSAENFSLALPDGISVASFEYESFSSVVFTLTGDVDNDSKISVTAAPSAFTEYFDNLFSGRSGCTATIADEAALRGYSSPGSYFAYSLTAVTGTSAASGGCGNNA